MSDAGKKDKNLKKEVVKPVVPPQSSAQDTSNWDDRDISVPQTKKRQRREFVYSRPSREYEEYLRKKAEELNQESVEPKVQPDTANESSPKNQK